MSYNYKRKSDVALSPSQKLTKTSVLADVQSKGLTSRIVKYHDSTQQSLYKRPGEFPIVHLKRNDVVLSKQRRSNSLSYIRINNPEQNATNLYNRRQILQRGLSAPDYDYRNDPLARTSHTDDGFSGTRSVLDALKEISRKRINRCDEEENEHKKLCTEPAEVVDGVKGPKRQRDPASPNSPSAYYQQPQHRPKKICTDNLDVISSMSSSLGLMRARSLVQKPVPRPQDLRPSTTNLDKIVPSSIPLPVLRTSVSAPLMRVEKKPDYSPPKITLFNQNYDTVAERETDLDSDDEDTSETSSIFVKPKKSSPILSSKSEVLRKIEHNKLAMMLKCLAGDFENSDDEDVVDAAKQANLKAVANTTSAPLIDLETPKKVEIVPKEAIPTIPILNPVPAKPLLPEDAEPKLAEPDNEPVLPAIITSPEKPGFQFATPKKTVEPPLELASKPPLAEIKKSTPAMFKFDTPKPVSNDSSITFGQNHPKSTTTTFNLTNAPTTAPLIQFGNTPSTSVAPSLQFGASSTLATTSSLSINPPSVPSVTFSLPQKKDIPSDSPLKPAFSFGGSEKVAPSAAPAFSFGDLKPATPATSTVTPSPAATPTVTIPSTHKFGTTTTTSSNPPISFGTQPAPTPTTFGDLSSKPSSQFAFNAPALATTSSGFSATTTASSFSNFNAKPISSGFSFSVQPASQQITNASATLLANTFSKGSSSTPSFSGFSVPSIASANSSTTIPSSVFGGTTSNPAPNFVNVFGSSASTASNKSEPIRPAFGAEASQPPTFGSSPFGNSASNPTNSAANQFSFGSTSATSSSAGFSGFGSAHEPAKPAEPATKADQNLFSFGGNTAQKPSVGFAFGGPSSTSAPSFASTGTSVFGGGANPPAGNPSFMSSSSGFGSPSFGGGSVDNKPNLFGVSSSTSNDQAKSFLFGGAAAGSDSKPPAFGQSPAFGGGAASNQPAVKSPVQSSASFQFSGGSNNSNFSFGGAPANPVPSQQGSPFAFGQSGAESQKPPPPSYSSATAAGNTGFSAPNAPVFNFGGAQQQPDHNQFGGNNMFSIGSSGGQTANQQRRAYRTAARRIK